MQKRKIAFYFLSISMLFFGSFPTCATSQVFPEIIQLPNAFSPEGIVRGYGTEFFTGSLFDGAIYKGDLRTGEGNILVDGELGQASVGLSFDERTGYLFVAGGGQILGAPSGTARVYNTANGSLVGQYVLSTEFSFINDVVITQTAAYFTDSILGVLYRLPLSPNGDLPDPSAIETIPLVGDFVITGGIDANGIDATPNGDALLISQSSLGYVYHVDPETGFATLVDLGGIVIDSADGILLSSNTLYIAQGPLNQIAVIELTPTKSTGTLVNTIVNPAFDFPTALDKFGNSLYAVNARLGTAPPGGDIEYSVVKITQ